MTDVPVDRMAQIVRGLLGKYMAQGIAPNEIDMDGLKEQLADAVTQEFGEPAFASDITIRIMRDMDDPNRVFVKVDPFEIGVPV